MGLQLFVISLSGVLMITLVNRFGTDTTAAFGATFQLWQYVQMPAFADRHGGARRWPRRTSARRNGIAYAAVARHGVWFSILLTTSIVVVIEVFSEQALGIFLPAGSVALRTAEHLNLIAAWSFILLAVSMVLFGVVRATGAVLPPLIILSLSLLGIRFPVALWLLDDLRRPTQSGGASRFPRSSRPCWRSPITNGADGARRAWAAACPRPPRCPRAIDRVVAAAAASARLRANRLSRRTGRRSPSQPPGD